MKTSYRFIQFTILAVILTLSINVFADVKIKAKQTVGGQSYEQTTYIKGKRQRTEMMNGMSVSITQCDLRRSVQLMPQTKVYTVSPFFDGTENVQKTSGEKVESNTQVKNTVGGLVTITTTNKDTGERKQMFGYTARHIITTIVTESSPDSCSKSDSKMEIDAWYIDATFALDCDLNQQYSQYQTSKPGGCQDKVQIKNIGTAKTGYPVWMKTTMFEANGKETLSMLQEVVEISQATLENSLFEIPADYREAKNATEMYASMSQPGSSTSISMTNASSVNNENASSNGVSQNIRNMANNSSAAQTETVGAKKSGVIRLGLANVKTGAVGEGLNASDLAAAIQNTLSEYLKAPNIELVQLEAKLPSAIEAEAREKECDFVIYANVAHKKGGGGGFGGMFGKVIAPAIAHTGIGHTGSVAGNIAGQVATTAIVSAGTMSANVKSKDEITLDIKLQQAGTVALTKQYKQKAKSDGEDIISPIIEQAAQAIVDAIGK